MLYIVSSIILYTFLLELLAAALFQSPCNVTLFWVNSAILVTFLNLCDHVMEGPFKFSFLLLLYHYGWEFISQFQTTSNHQANLFYMLESLTTSSRYPIHFWL